MALPEVLTVTVKQPHIEEGTPGDPSDCPFAIAIRDQIFPYQQDEDRNYWDHTVEVLGDLTTIDRLLYSNPADMEEWINRYDDLCNELDNREDIVATVKHYHIEPMTATLIHVATMI